MEYRRLGRAGLKVSVLGLGTWLTFADRATAVARVDAAVDAGINLFDTANTDGHGEAEILLGQALARHRREALVVATKVWGRMGDGPNDAGLSRKHIVGQCEASLRRLGLEYLDLYQCQRYDPETTLEETLRAMDDLLGAGKILYWGISGWSETELANAMRLSDAQQLAAPSSYQVRGNLLEPEEHQAIQPACARHGLGLLAYSPLAQGVLTGKYRDGLPPDSRLADERLGRNLASRYGERLAAPVIAELADEAARHGATLAQVALARTLAWPGITAAIMGARTADQVRENVGAVRLVGENGNGPGTGR